MTGGYLFRHPVKRCSTAAADIKNPVILLHLPVGKGPAGHLIMALVHALQHFLAFRALRLAGVADACHLFLCFHGLAPSEMISF